MKNIKIDFTGIGMTLLALTALVMTITISWVMIEQTNLDNQTKIKMLEYELREKRLKIESDSLNLESLKRWNGKDSQYWEGRGEE